MKLRVAFGHLLSVRRHVRAEEAERGVVDLHADADAALVTHHAKQSRCHGGCYEGDDDDWDPTADSGDGGSERDTCKYAHEHANEDLGAHAVVRVFLIMTILHECDWIVVHPMQCGLDFIEPQLGSLLRLGFRNHCRGGQIYHFFQTQHEDIRLRITPSLYHSHA